MSTISFDKRWAEMMQHDMEQEEKLLAHMSESERIGYLAAKASGL